MPKKNQIPSPQRRQKPFHEQGHSRQIQTQGENYAPQFGGEGRLPLIRIKPRGGYLPLKSYGPSKWVFVMPS